MELSLAVANPRIISEAYKSIGLPLDMTSANTVTAASCLGLYLYNRPTLAGNSLPIRGAYSLYYSTLFVLGSVLGWAILARSMSSCPVFRSLLMVGSSV